MDGKEFRFEQGDRVRLRDGVDPSFYDGMSVLGNEGWIDDRRRDKRFGLPEVHIRWDRNHWAYNEAPDKWTFEDHFDKVEEQSMDEPSKSDIARQLALDFANQFASLIGEEKGQEKKQEEIDVVEVNSNLRRILGQSAPTGSTSGARRPTEYEIAVDSALDRLQNSEAFIIIAVERQEHRQAKDGLLAPFAMSFAATPEAELLAEGHMTRLAAEAHQEMVLRKIIELVDDGA